MTFLAACEGIVTVPETAEEDRTETVSAKVQEAESDKEVSAEPEEQAKTETVKRLKSRKKISGSGESVVDEYIYDDDNNLIRFDGHIYEYDENGRLITDNITDENAGDPDDDFIYDTYAYEYDDKDNVMCKKHYVRTYDFDSEEYSTEFSDYEANEYDGNGNIISCKEYIIIKDSETGGDVEKLSDYNRYMYDETGRLTERIWIGPFDEEEDDGWHYILSYAGDSDKPSQVVVHDPSGQFADEEKINDFDENGNILLEHDFGSDLVTEYTYDSEGNVLTSREGEWICYDSDNSYSYYENRTFEYIDSLLVKETFEKEVSDAGLEDKAEKYTYEYTYEEIDKPVK